VELFLGKGIAADTEGRQGTAWGLMNAVTEYTDHKYGNSHDNRLNSAWFGANENLKVEVLSALKAM
jgi:Domain of unknown function (DUF932).